VMGAVDISGKARLVSGQIDRLVVNDAGVTIIDYKTSRWVPKDLEHVPKSHLVQLALYRELMRRIYPDRTVVSALLWTQAPKLMPLPDEILDAALVQIA
jgi:ATP-dependent helicase/nuclease subunit A